VPITRPLFHHVAPLAVKDKIIVGVAGGAVWCARCWMPTMQAGKPRTPYSPPRHRQCLVLHCERRHRDGITGLVIGNDSIPLHRARLGIQRHRCASMVPTKTRSRESPRRGSLERSRRAHRLAWAANFHNGRPVRVRAPSRGWVAPRCTSRRPPPASGFEFLQRIRLIDPGGLELSHIAFMIGQSGENRWRIVPE